MEGLVPLSWPAALASSRAGVGGTEASPGLTQPHGSRPPFSGAVSRTQPLPRGVLPSPGEVTRSQIGSFLNHRTLCSPQAALSGAGLQTPTWASLLLLPRPPEASLASGGMLSCLGVERGVWREQRWALEDSHHLLAGCLWNRPVDDGSSRPSSHLVLVLRGCCCLGLASTTRGGGPQRGHFSAP